MLHLLPYEIYSLIMMFALIPRRKWFWHQDKTIMLGVPHVRRNDSWMCRSFNKLVKEMNVPTVLIPKELTMHMVLVYDLVLCRYHNGTEEHLVIGRDEMPPRKFFEKHVKDLRSCIDAKVGNGVRSAMWKMFGYEFDTWTMFGYEFKKDTTTMDLCPARRNPPIRYSHDTRTGAWYLLPEYPEDGIRYEIVFPGTAFKLTCPSISVNISMVAKSEPPLCRSQRGLTTPERVEG